MRSSLLGWLGIAAAVTCFVATSGCGAPPLEPKTFGALPSATTQATPLWIPLQVRAGRQVATDAGDHPRFETVRQVTLDGKSDQPHLLGNGHELLIRSQADGCAKWIVLNVGTGQRQVLGPAHDGATVVSPDELVVAAPDDGACMKVPVWPATPAQLGPGKLVRYRRDADGAWVRATSPLPSAHSPTSSDGLMVFVVGGKLHWRPAGGDATTDLRITGAHPTISRDGQWVVWESGFTGAGEGRSRVGLKRGYFRHHRNETFFDKARINVQPYFGPANNLYFATNFGADDDAISNDLDIVSLPPNRLLEGLTRWTRRKGYDGEPNLSDDAALLSFVSDRAGPGKRDVYVASVSLE